MCKSNTTCYDDSHGPVVLCFELFDAGYASVGVDYDEKMNMYFLSLRRTSDNNETTVSVISKDDVKNILALEKKMRERL